MRKLNVDTIVALVLASAVAFWLVTELLSSPLSASVKVDTSIPSPKASPAQ